MPLPLVPIALGLGGAVLGAWAAVRRSPPARIDQRAEDALDDVPEGLATRRATDDRGQSNATLRLARTITLPGGRRYRLDTALLARIRLTKV